MGKEKKNNLHFIYVFLNTKACLPDTVELESCSVTLETLSSQRHKARPLGIPSLQTQTTSYLKYQLRYKYL